MEDEAMKRRERLKALRSLKAENPETEISLKRMRQDAENDQSSKERKTEEDEDEANSE